MGEMIKAIIFDFWGTLVEQGTYSPLRQSYNILRVRMPFSPFVVKFESVFMLKKYEDQANAFRAVCNAFNIGPDPSVIDKLIGVWNKSKLLAKPYEETIPVLESLKSRGFKLALISNCPYNSTEPVLEKFDLTKYFDVIMLSWDVGYLKTDPKMFESILRRLHLDKSEVLMVGDSIQTDIEGAEAVGITPVLVDRQNRREYPRKIPTLYGLDNYLK